MLRPMSSKGSADDRRHLGARRLVLDPAADFTEADVAPALDEAEGYGIDIEGTPWDDVRRAWELSQGSIRYTHGVFIAHAERTHRPLLTADRRPGLSGADLRCAIIEVRGHP